MLALNFAEASLLRLLETGEKTENEVTVHLGRTDVAAADYVRVIAHKINHKAKKDLVKWKNGPVGVVWYVTEAGTQYQIIEGMRNTLDELATLSYETNWKMVVIFFGVVVVVGVLCLFLGYYVGVNSGILNVSLDPSVAKNLFKEACGK